MKIPRSIKKKIKEQAKIESGFYGSQKSKDFESMSPEEKMKDSQRYARKQRFKDSTIGKMIGSGIYNKVKVKEGAKLEKDDKITPPKPKLQESGYKHREFSNNQDASSEGTKVFSVSAKSSKEAISKIQSEKEKLGVKDTGSGSTVDLSEHPEQKDNVVKMSKYKKEKPLKYQVGERTAKMGQ